ncbi:chromophore lyase CpcT/CpeT, partial [Staphylococcus aureus]
LLTETQHSHAFQIQYLALKQPRQFRGAAANPSKLAQLSLTDLELLPGCTLMVTQQDGTFTAQPEPEAKCYFQYEGKTRQVILGFEVGAGRFLSYDRGVDPETGQALWGAVLAPYEFNKCQDFAAELPLD